MSNTEIVTKVARGRNQEVWASELLRNGKVDIRQYMAKSCYRTWGSRYCDSLRNLCARLQSAGIPAVSSWSEAYILEGEVTG